MYNAWCWFKKASCKVFCALIDMHEAAMLHQAKRRSGWTNDDFIREELERQLQKEAKQKARQEKSV